MELSRLVIIAAALCSCTAFAAPTEFYQAMQPFLKEHCECCHNEKKHKGDFRLDSLSRDLVNGPHASRWADLLDKIASGEMPPDDQKKEPKAEERDTIVEWIAARLKEGETARIAKRECVTFAKLTRDEPLGRAFDNYDAIGRWRTEGVVGDGANPKVDASGKPPDGRSFKNAADFKKLLLADLDKFNAAFIEKPATFATRRVMTFDDRAALNALAKQGKAADHRLRDIVEALVMSELFRNFDCQSNLEFPTCRQSTTLDP